MFFSVVSSDKGSSARTGILNLPHGKVNTPVFMPVGTNGTVKAVSVEDLKEIGFEIISHEESDTFSVVGGDAPTLLRVIAKK